MPEEKPSPSSVPKKPPENGGENAAGTQTDGKPASGADAAKPVGEAPAQDNPPGQKPKPSASLEAEPLSDGTVPTILAPGASHRSIPKTKTSLSRIYRRADITTTLLTFIGAVIAALVILGGYAYFTRSKVKPTPTPKVTALDKSDLEKLQSFFEGNTAGGSDQVLTINSSTLFKGRVAVASDLKVTGGLEIGGASTLGDLSVQKTSTLGVTNIRGALSVAGPLNVQSPTTFAAGAAVTGNLAATGNGSFSGSLSAATLSVRDISVTNINLAGHLNISGSSPTASPNSASAVSASVAGNDTSGTVTVNVKPVGPLPQPLGAQLVTVNFHAAYPRAPTVVITPVGRGAAVLQPYVLVTANSFTIGASVLDANSNITSYSFNYWIAQ